MNTNLTTFTFAPTNANVRTVKLDGEPWFVMVDVLRSLDLYVYGGKVNTSKAVGCLSHGEYRTEGEKVIHPWAFDARVKEVTLVSESGLYKFIMRANPNANPMVRKFQDWVTREVLPAIRKDGMYVMGEEKVRTGEMDVAAYSPDLEVKWFRLTRSAQCRTARHWVWAERLGMAQPLNVRPVIPHNWVELEGFGEVLIRPVKTSTRGVRLGAA